MSMDPADWLAAVATATLPRSSPTHEPVLVPAALERRMVALMIDGFAMFFGGGFLALVLTFVGWAWALNMGDFDGPSQFNALGDWLLFGTWSGVALLYTAAEAFGRETPGKWAAGLRLVVHDGNRRRRLLLRWLVAYSPLLLLTLIYFAGAVHTGAVGWEAFDDVGHAPSEILLVVVGPLVVLWLFGFGWAAGPRKRTLAEAAAGVQLLRRLPPPSRQRPGFDVLPAAQPVLRA